MREISNVPAQPENPDRMKSKSLVAIAIASGAVAAYILWEMHWRSVVTTDNAHVDGNLLRLDSHVDSEVVAVYAKENQFVRKGDVLLALDGDRLESRVDEIAAEIDKNHAEAGKVTQEIAMLAAESSAAYAKNDAMKSERSAVNRHLQRMQQLSDQQLVSQDNLERVRREKSIADSEVAISLADTQGIEAKAKARQLEREASHADRKRLERLLRSAKHDLRYRYLRAPTDAYVVNFPAQVGELVSKGEHQITLLPVDQIWIEANFKETEIARVMASKHVDVVIDAYPDRVFRGRIASISPIAGAKRSVLPPNFAYGNFTRLVQRVPIRVELIDADAKRMKILPGMSAKATVPVL